eukprot:c10159_g1_i1.p1 GENE.c10159_g1_i1~~c10159_g1_i1.p1  ORF type:complete len:262 (-),score=39.41 c10159_g1_i1:170-955(-)
MADSLITQVSREDEARRQSGRAAAAQPDGRTGTSGGAFSCFGCCRKKEAARRPDDDALATELEDAPQYASTNKCLLGAPLSAFRGRKTLVLDLDETLVHSSFKPVSFSDFVVPVELDREIHQVFVLKRPFVDRFLKRVGEIFEVVVFTASLSRYADPVLDLLDKSKSVHARLFREHCVNHHGNYVKDLDQLGRRITDVAIIDNSPASYMFHPSNAIPVTSWFDNSYDTELLDLLPLLEELAYCDDVTKVLAPLAAGARFRR